MSLIAEGLKDALPLIEKFAPTIGSVIGGVPGFAASSALSLLGKAFDTHSGDIHQLASSILNDPNVEDKLRGLDESHGLLIKNFVDELNKMMLSKADIHIQLEWAMRPPGSTT